MTLSIYLGDVRPTWRPETETDICQAIADGILVESHYLDLKRELSATARANRDLAQDMAALAIDSGTILIGVREGPEGRLTPTPVPLEGLSERIEQIARTKPDPPLAVSSSVIRSDYDPAAGFVLVHVPVSPSAPHMVDNIYFGRGDKTNVRLSDPEVERHFARRRRALIDSDAVLDRLVNRDPIPAEMRRSAHIYLIATPVYPREEMLLSALDLRAWTTKIAELVRSVLGAQGAAFALDLHEATQPSRRADGVALTSYALGNGRILRADAGTEQLIEVEFGESGEIRIFQSRLSDAPHPDGPQEVLAVTMPTLARRIIDLASRIAEITGYRGTWLLGVAATGVAGLPGYSPDIFGRMRAERAAFDQTQPDYRQVAFVSQEELAATPGELTRRLTGRFLRALGQERSPDISRLLLDDTRPDNPA